MRVVRALLIVLVVALAESRLRAAERPNVVLIIADDQGWDDFGFMGSEIVRTPNLDRLAARSAVFPNGYVPTSLCRASLATLLTGLYGSQHKICCNDFPTDSSPDRSGTHPFIKGVPTVPRLLRDDGGYLSLQTGKFWEGHYTNAGFTDGMTTKGRHGDDGLVIGRQTMQPVYDFINKATTEKKPFFVWYAPMMPHTPHNPPKRLLAKYRDTVESPHVAAYYAMCEWFDETVGQLLGFLDEKKLTDNTIVLFVIDNGWVQQPGSKGKFDVRSKRSPYDAGLRTPILIAWPGKVKAARHDDLVSSIDLSATILSACNVATSKTMQGQSLLDVAAGQGKLNRDAVFGEIYTNDALVLDKPVLSMTHKWARVGDLKLIRPEPPDRSGRTLNGDTGVPPVPATPEVGESSSADSTTNTEHGQDARVTGAPSVGRTDTKPSQPELYDLKADPHEKTNLAVDRPDDVRRLSARIDAWWTRLHPATP